MSKLDLYALHRAEYVAPRKPAFVDIKPAQYLTICGAGKPGGSQFQVSLAALYKAAFTIKMASKFAGRDYAVSKLEGLYSSTDEWTLIIRTPDFIGAAALWQIKAKVNADVRLETLNEGRCVQVLHIGPYDKETASIEAMKIFAAENDRKPRGEHHEIYLSDPRRVAPEKLRTILRQPVV